MTYYEIITKLIGSVQPSGNASIDPQRKESLLKTIELVDQLLNDIRSSAVSKDRYEASMKEIGWIAHNYLSNLELELGEYFNREVIKPGTKVKIIDNESNHRFDIGETVIIQRYNDLNNDWVASNGNDYWYLDRNDFEILESYEKSNL